MDDLKWLYFDLAMRGALKNSRIQHQLEDFIRQPILGPLRGKQSLELFEH